MKSSIFKILALILGLCIILAGISSCTKKDKTHLPEKLGTPVLTLNENMAQWTEIENAEHYSICVDGTISEVGSNILC